MELYRVGGDEFLAIIKDPYASPLHLYLDQLEMLFEKDFVVNGEKIKFGIRYSDDADKAIRIIKNLVEELPLTMVNPPAFVFVDALGDNSVDIVARIWTHFSYLLTGI